MRLSVPNVLHAFWHPLRATRYLLYRDRIPYRRIRRYLPKDPVIVEAGAHNGSNTAEMADFWPSSTIHAFEPVPSAVAAVRARAAKYGSRVQCHQLALGGQDAAMEMHMSGDGSVGCCQSSSLLPPTKAHSREFPFIRHQMTVEVNVRRLDSWALESGVAKVDFMWLDMEGYELEALSGASHLLPQVSAIHMEVCNVLLYDGAPLYTEVKRTMDGLGFVPVVEAFFRVCGNVLFVRRHR